MRYLFFDIECCDGRHICEFGYVITNEKFESLEKRVITVNPERSFNLVGRKNQDDLVLYFSEDTYFSSPAFPAYYMQIKELMEEPEQIVIGHSVGNDAGFLRTACNRYGLDSINFSFVDSQRIYSEFSNDKRQISLEKAESLFDLEKPQYLHKSDDDALLTAQLVQNMCERLEMSLSDVMTLCPTACGESRNFNISYVGSSLKEMLEALKRNPKALSHKKRESCVKMFSHIAHPEGEIVKSQLNGKKLSFSLQFEKENTKDLLVIIQLLANHGCTYNAMVSEVNYYVPGENELSKPEPEKNTRYFSATQMGRNIKLLSLAELLDILGITVEELSEMQIPEITENQTEQAEMKKNSKSYYSVGRSATTLGDILRSKGINLSKI